MATQFSVNDSRMHRGCTYAAIPVTFVECDRKEDVRSFGSSVGNEGLIGRVLKVGILEVDIGIAVTARRKIDQPPARTNERRNPVDQDKVAQVIGTELRFEAIAGAAQGRGH